MARTTHDVNLDHHGALQMGVDTASYPASSSIASVIASIDERLVAMASGRVIVLAYATASAVIRSTPSGSASADAVIA